MDGTYRWPRAWASVTAHAAFIGLLVMLTAGCEQEQPHSPADPPPLVYDPDYEPSPPPLPGPTETPGADAVGKGLIVLWQISVTEAHGDTGQFEMQAEIPFKVYYNGSTGVWEAVGQSTRADGAVVLNTKAGECRGMFTGMTHMKGTIIPPNTLIADPEGCKLVAHFTQYWSEVPFNCDNEITYSEPETMNFLGPITFRLVKGNVQMESFEKILWHDTYRYEIKELDLPFETNCVVFEPDP